MKIILTGSVAYDYLMSFPGHFREHILTEKLETISLSFLVESMVKRRGGIAPNIAYTLALLGGNPSIMATVGEDFDEYRRWLDKHGVDTSMMKVIPDEFTASFFANTDRSNAQIASFYPGAMAHASSLTFHEFSNQEIDLAVISPNDPDAMNNYVSECIELGIPYLYDPSQQIIRLDGEDLRKGLDHAKALFVNDYEFNLIQSRTGMTREEILENLEFLVVTMGEEGAVIYTDDQEIHIPVVPPQQIIDPTGVGDAFRGGFLTGIRNNLDLPTCGQLGSLAATYCLETDGPQSHTYTQEQFVSRFREHFDDQRKLDVILEK